MMITRVHNTAKVLSISVVHHDVAVHQTKPSLNALKLYHCDQQIGVRDTYEHMYMYQRRDVGDIIS